MDATQAEILKEGLLGKSVDGWAITGYLGCGKSAVVMRGEKDGEVAAVKVFHPELIERYGRKVQLERIVREASLVGAAHPHLVKILGGGECSLTNHLFIVMELLAYPNLHDVIEAVPVESIPTIIQQVASAARFLEDRGLAHRDIKPENIAISQDFSHVVLLDLGVLRPIGNSDLTDVDQRLFIATLRYSSPEYLTRREQDTLEGWRAITFYQLGAVLHDLLMRRPLFHERSEPFSLLVEAVMTEAPEIFGQDTVCVALAKHCLVKNPNTRLQLVSWERFQALVSEEDVSTKAARERIRERQAYFQSSASEVVAGQSVESCRPSRRTLDDVCNRLESRIAALMNSLQIFPLRTTQSFKDPAGGVCSTLVTFDKDDAKGIPFRISVLIRMKFLDDNNGAPIYVVDVCSGLSLHELSATDLANLQSVHSGEVPEFLDGPALEEVFVQSLDFAYEFVEKGESLKEGQIVLVVEGGGA